MSTASSSGVSKANDSQQEIAKLRNFCVDTIGLPPEIAEVFATNMVPPGALKEFTFDPSNNTFRITMHSGREGEITGVNTKAGFNHLNGAKVKVADVVEGTYDKATRSIKFEGAGGISVKKGWLPAATLQGLSVVQEPDDTTKQLVDKIKIGAAIPVPAGSLPRFEKTFGPENLLWAPCS
jgi:hypothetical protein